MKNCFQCQKTDSDTEKMYQCSKCKSVYYCSKECQIQHWKKHKKQCQLKLLQRVLIHGDEQEQKKRKDKRIIVVDNGQHDKKRILELCKEENIKDIIGKHIVKDAEIK